MEQLKDLPPETAAELTRFMEAAKKAWGGDLLSVILYGSAAEGRLRHTSDVNLLLVLRAFTRAQADGIREPLRSARVAIRLGVMFVLESEIDAAGESFSVKFDDIRARHRVLFGENPFAGHEMPRARVLAQIRQTLLNLHLRLRERYASVGLREEQLAGVTAEAAGPLRACAAALCRLEGWSAENPKAALERVVAELKMPELDAVLAQITDARADGLLPPGSAGDAVFGLMGLVSKMYGMVERLAGG